jgi:hypothetical protein
VQAAVSNGRVETIENQVSARSALRLEALLKDPIKEHSIKMKNKKELNSIISNNDKYRGKKTFLYFSYLQLQSF